MWHTTQQLKHGQFTVTNGAILVITLTIFVSYCYDTSNYYTKTHPGTTTGSRSSNLVKYGLTKDIWLMITEILSKTAT